MWKVLKTFESEAEARVVESFLTAKGLDVQLLGTHSKYTVMAPSSMTLQGLRLMVRDEQVDAASQFLREQERSTHLSLVNEEPMGRMPGRRAPVWISVMLLAAAAAALIKKFF
jgi:hypothetical protein